MSLGSPPYLRTPLNAVHRRLGARMVDFAGWDMPLQYPSGILAEHEAVRTTCGVFDLSHMGRVFLRGAEALALAQACCTRDLARVPDSEAAYSLLCLPDGGILDDVIVYRLEPREVLLVVNAANRAADVAWLIDQRDSLQLSVDIDDQTPDTALIGVQGPAAQHCLQPLCTDELERLHGYAFVVTRVAGHEALVSRTGYTGEDGFEVLLISNDAAAVWEALLDSANQASPSPCGLGARDTLRTEAALALYGHEIDETTNPYEARLGWVVNLDKQDFVGRAALASIKESGPTRRLVGLHVEPGGVPRPGNAIMHEGSVVGTLTSGTFSPTLKRNIGLGYVPIALSSVGLQLGVELRGRAVGAEVIKLPFVPHRTRSRATM
jgi:aminomethyltransferase